jgi:hypothetical protein
LGLDYDTDLVEHLSERTYEKLDHLDYKSDKLTKGKIDKQEKKNKEHA